MATYFVPHRSQRTRLPCASVSFDSCLLHLPSLLTTTEPDMYFLQYQGPNGLAAALLPSTLLPASLESEPVGSVAAAACQATPSPAGVTPSTGPMFGMHQGLLSSSQLAVPAASYNQQPGAARTQHGLPHMVNMGSKLGPNPMSAGWSQDSRVVPPHVYSYMNGWPGDASVMQALNPMPPVWGTYHPASVPDPQHQRRYK